MITNEKKQKPTELDEPTNFCNIIIYCNDSTTTTTTITTTTADTASTNLINNIK